MVSLLRVGYHILAQITLLEVCISPARILVVDDNDLARRTIRTILESHGLNVCAEARNGREAIRFAVQQKPDLIVLDWVMPDLDGLDAARRILTLLPAVPIVINTLFGNDQLDLEAKKVGVREVVSKANANSLIGAVNAWLPKSTV